MALAPLALTMGDPAGIGGELTLRAWQARRAGRPFFVLDDPERLADIVAAQGVPVPIRTIDTAAHATAVFRDALPVLSVPLTVVARPGRPDTANAQPVIDSITRAVQLTQAGEAAAVVTNPISKANLYEAGFTHPGHTEFIAELTGCHFPVMMLLNPRLRVVPVTIHVSLRQSLEMLTTGLIVRTARVVAAALRRDFGLVSPRLAVAGLNPHAGEQGAMGDEEIRIIRPAMETLRAEGIAVSGPWSPDTMFTEESRNSYDVVLGMYHDQVLIPLKTLDMHHGVNMTLGLPIIRTSPDHGTAFDIAGTGRADPSSLIAALDLAAELAARKEATA